MKAPSTIRKRTLFLVTLLFLLCLVVMTSLRPQTIKCTPAPPSSTQMFAGYQVIDLGAVLRVEDLAWKNTDGLAVVASNGTSHLWIYYCSASRAKAEERALITLKEQEVYRTIRVLPDETAAIVTNQRFIYLDERLQEKRSVYLRNLGEIQEASLSPTGNRLAYVQEEGLFCYCLSDDSRQLLVESGKNGARSKPTQITWIDEQTVGYRYSTSQGALSCGIVPVHQDGQPYYWEECGISAAMGLQYAGMESSHDPSIVQIKELSSNRDVRYEIPNHVLCALVEGNQSLYPITLDTQSGAIYFNRIDTSGGSFTTLFSLEAGKGSLNTRTLRLSPASKLAVELYPPHEGNSKILLVDMSTPIFT
ncbi:MAG: hypothetical protein HFE39_03065 [Clostridiales bacterium]|jgi:hypothetical protein|nr:hypothetical protein [Clostridiales bacterium]